MIKRYLQTENFVLQYSRIQIKATQMIKNNYKKGELMANTSNFTFKIYNPKNSDFANKIQNELDRDVDSVFNQYFVKDNGVSWRDDLNNILNERWETDYRLLASLNGDPLEYMYRKINICVPPYIPEGYKLNAKKVLDTLETLCNENRQETSKSALSAQTTRYIVEITRYLISGVLAKSLKIEVDKILSAN